MKKSSMFLLLSCLLALSPRLLKCDEIDSLAQALKKIEQPVISEDFSAEVLEIIKDNAILVGLAKQDKDFRDVLDKNLATLLVDAECVDCVKYLTTEKVRKNFIEIVPHIEVDKTTAKKIEKTLKGLAEQKEPTEATKMAELEKELKNKATDLLNNFFDVSTDDLGSLIGQASSDASYDVELLEKVVTKAAGVKSGKLTAEQFVLVFFEWANKELYDSVKDSDDFLSALAKKPETIVAILNCDPCVDILKDEKFATKEKLKDAATVINNNQWDVFDIENAVTTAFKGDDFE